MLAGLRLAAGAVAALALTLVVAWPLPRCLGTCLGASQDPPISVYFLRWFAHALTTPGVRLLDAGIFAPYAGTLALGEYAPAWALVALPAIVATGNPVLGHNVVVVAAYTLATLGAAALAARLLGPGAAAGLAGVAFAFSPRLLHQAHNIQGLAACWLPWLLLALERFLARPTWPAAAAVAAAGLALGFSSLSGLAFAGIALLVWLAAAAWGGGRQVGRAHATRLSVPGLPAAAVLWLVAIAPFRTLAREWHLGRTLADNERYSASLGDWLGVPPEHLLHRLVGIGRVVDLDHEALFPGVATGALAAVGLWTLVRRPDVRRALRPYVAAGAAGALLALGPTLETPWGRLPLPYRALFEWAPGFEAIRAPRRFAAVVCLAVALLAAAGAGSLLARVSRRARRVLAAALAAVVLLESWTVPFPGTVRRLDAGSLPPVYRWLAAEPPPTLALVLPMGDDWEAVAAAAFHLRPTVNGWSSYTPPHYHALVEAMARFPDARSLALIRGIRPDVVLVDRRWLGSGRPATPGGDASGLRLERTVGRHHVLRLVAPPTPGVESLEAVGAPPACVTLRNPGPDHVPLYPVRRLRLVAEADGRTVAEARGLLPLDLAPGAAHTLCARTGGGATASRMHGTIAGGERSVTFTVTPGGKPEPTAPPR